MSPERASAYRRVIQTLSELGPTKLQDRELERIREAADTLVFSRDMVENDAAQDALSEVEHLLRRLVDSGRWERVTANRLARDVVDCGPAQAPELRAA
jgi:hypothetical protein